jgi:hypothetical protein
MKKHNINLFGVPTIFTVLIVVLIISFSTLSYLNALNIRHSIDRGNKILEDSYTIQRDMEILITDLETSLNEDKTALENIRELKYDQESGLYTIYRAYENLQLDVKFRLIYTQRVELEIVEWILTSGNNQDYTQDGDPVYGG